MIVNWFALPFLVTGLTLLGFCLGRGYHYMLTAFAWGLYVFGTMIASVGVSAYQLDAYPRGSGEVGAWINFSRTAAGFVVAYFQVRWVAAMGPEKTFGIQAAVCAGVFPIVILLQVFGRRLRHISGDLDFKTN